MKVVMIVMDTRAICRYTAHLCNTLSRDHQVIAITPLGIDKGMFDGLVKVVSLPVGYTKRDFIVNTLIFTRMLNFLKAIKGEQPDIIHFQHGFNFWTSILLRWLRKYPIVTTLHDVEPHLGQRRLDRIIARNLHVKYSQALIVHGQKEKKKLELLFENIGREKRCFVIPHGEFSSFVKHTKQHIPEETAVLFFGQIAEYKGLEYLIKASPLILERIPNAKIIIAGRGSLRKYAELIRNTPNLEIRNKWILDHEVATFFQRSKVVVLPYVDGSQTGLIPIAYAFKKPVIVTDVGSIPEVVDEGKTGFIVRPRDPKALAEAIVKLLSDNELQKEMGQNAFLKMKQELSWDNIAQKTLECYQEIIRDRKIDTSSFK